jgi:hypothetical protein
MLDSGGQQIQVAPHDSTFHVNGLETGRHTLFALGEDDGQQALRLC